MHHDYSVEIAVFIFSLILVFAAGVADYYYNHRYSNPDVALYRHEVTAFYVDGNVDQWNYHIVYNSQLVSDEAFFSDDHSTPIHTFDDIVPQHIYHRIKLGMVITSSTDQIQWYILKDI